MLNTKLRTLANKIRDRELRKKVIELVQNPTVEIGGETYSGMSLASSPGALSHHHGYPGGYLEHVVSSLDLALALCDTAEKVYHGKVNRDQVIAGILLHDIFKTISYQADEYGNYISAPIAEFLDHVSLATAELIRRGFPMSIVHIVTAHYGEYGPIRPHTLEALICHLADFADSRLNGETMRAASYLTRRATGEELPRMNSKEAFEIVHSKSVEGWKGVQQTVERIQRKRETHNT